MQLERPYEFYEYIIKRPARLMIVTNVNPKPVSVPYDNHTTASITSSFIVFVTPSDSCVLLPGPFWSNRFKFFS